MRGIIGGLATSSMVLSMLISGAVGSIAYAARKTTVAKSQTKRSPVQAKYSAKASGKASGKATGKPSGKNASNKAGRRYSLAQTMIAAKKIDQLAQADYKRSKVAPAGKASDEDFLRRVYLDLVGRIPTYDEAVAFLELRKPSKRSELIDHLLKSPGYNSTMFNFWADMLRIQTRSRFDPTAEYGKWVKQAIAENKPYDEIVYELLTSNGRTKDNGAAGYYLRDSGMPLDNASLTAQIFLGTQIGCAQCHDHPFDKWTQMDFYQFASYTAQVRTRGRAVGGQSGMSMRQMRSSYAKMRQQMNKLEANERQMLQLLLRVNSYRVSDTYKPLKLPEDYQYDDAKPGQTIKPKVIFGAEPELKSRTDTRNSFAGWLTSKDNPQFAKVIANRLWKKMMGIGLVEPVDDFSDTNKAANPELLDYLAKLMVDVDFDIKQYLRVLSHSRVYQLSTSRRELTPENYHAQGAVLRRLGAEQIWDSLLTIAVDKVDTRQSMQVNFGRYGMLAQIDADKMKPDELIATAKKLAEARKNPRAAMASNPNAARMRQEMMKRRREFGGSYTRASEMQSPMPAGHFLAQFGQARREAPNDGHNEPTVPQALSMMNGQVTKLLMSSRSVLSRNMAEFTEPKDRINVMWLSILSRKPTSGEVRMALGEIRENGNKGYGNLIWALVNSREFMFIK